MNDRKILLVATNDATLINGKKTGLWLSELTHFLEVVVKAGYEWDLASPKGGKIPLDEGSATPKQLEDPANARFMKDPRFVEALERSIPCAQVDPSQYVAVYLSGGHGTMFDFRQSPDLQKVITAMSANGAYLTGVCHGVAGFVDAVDASGASLVKGRLVTGFSNMEDTLAGSKSSMPFLLEDALEAAGAKYKKNLLPFTCHVETDGKLITGQNPQSARKVGEALLAAVQR